LGMNGGESPGIPYVMEIWPAGHYSPVHSHAAADAVIRVLHGSIHVSLYPFLSDSVPPFGEADFALGDITWISPSLNQTHQLKNITKDVCVTIHLPPHTRLTECMPTGVNCETNRLIQANRT